MPHHTSLNLAMIVHRLLVSRRGWRVDRLIADLGIKERTYRKYRQRLQTEFAPFRGELDAPRVVEVREGEARYLRLRDDDVEATGPDSGFARDIAALHLGRQLMEFVADTDIAESFEEILEEFRRRVGDRPYVVRRMMRHADRMFFHVPDAPKDYRKKRRAIRQLTHALIFTREVDVVYAASNAETRKRRLQPLSLVSHRSALYLLAREGAQARVKTYAIDRVTEVTRTTTHFEYPSRNEFDPASFVDGHFGIFQEYHDRWHDVELVFADIKWLKVHLRERTWHPSQRFAELPDGRLRMTFRCVSMTEVWPWIRSFGDDVEVVKPAH